MNYQRLPPKAVDRVLQLVTHHNLQSVGAEEFGLVFWQQLCAIQLQRAEQLGCEAQQALQLYASDMGVPQESTAQGGYIHVSYEGIVPGQLTLLPHWRTFFKDLVIDEGKLAPGVCSERHPEKPQCQIVVTDRDFGELPCAMRENVDGWFFYIEHTLLA